jgi:hypothetical protein
MHRIFLRLGGGAPFLYPNIYLLIIISFSAFLNNRKNLTVYESILLWDPGSYTAFSFDCVCTHRLPGYVTLIVYIHIYLFFILNPKLHLKVSLYTAKNRK